jgi:hypothetical protein
MDELRKQYKDTTLRLLGGFQLLEFALKIYIGLTYKTIQARLQGIAHFDYEEDELDELPLGRLLFIFKKLNSNVELQARLHGLRKKRNIIAHRSLLITMGPLYDNGAFDDKHIEYFTLEDDLTECVRKVNNESQKLKVRAKVK